MKVIQKENKRNYSKRLLHPLSRIVITIVYVESYKSLHQWWVLMRSG